MIVFDGHFYECAEDCPDLGSWECTEFHGNVRSYQGLSHDVSKLPKYDDLGAGSSAMCLDTGDYYIYHPKTRTWYKQ